MADRRRLDAFLKRTQRDFRRLLEADRVALSTRLERAYAPKMAEIKRSLKVLQEEVASRDLSTLDLLTLPAFEQAKRDVARLLGEIEPTIRNTVSTAQRMGTAAGVAFALIMGKALGEQFVKPNRDVLKATITLADNPAIDVTLARFGDYHAQHMADMVTATAAQGRSPAYAVAQLRRYFDGFPVADAERMVRTMQLWTARLSTLQTYKDNGTVEGWIWSSALDAVTCPACIAMHGSRHTLDETMDSHYNCRCAMIPITPSWDDLGFSDGADFTLTTGEEWLLAQPDEVQQSILGAAMYAALQDGSMTLKDVIGTYHDDVYGSMLRARSLTEIIGQDAARAYRRQPQ